MIMEAYEKLLALATTAKDDMEKAADGNKAAGTRARKAMQEIREQAKVVRDAILQARGSSEGN
ncbi:MAG: histone H1 [Planctomycetota bacterium]|nr:histone H1 [Planctomycetota bacterium]